MIPINLGKFNLPKGVVSEKCADESVRLIRYTVIEQPKELLTMRPLYAWDPQNSPYEVVVHVPPQRSVDVVICISHTSVNCWKYTISSASGCDFYTFNTLRDVLDALELDFNKKV